LVAVVAAIAVVPAVTLVAAALISPAFAPAVALVSPGLIAAAAPVALVPATLVAIPAFLALRRRSFPRPLVLGRTPLAPLPPAPVRRRPLSIASDDAPAIAVVLVLALARTHAIASLPQPDDLVAPSPD
jgi:hypothetical protein